MISSICSKYASPSANLSSLTAYCAFLRFDELAILPYHVNLPIWFEYYTRLTIFVQQRRNATLYIHAYVNLPWVTITQSIRQTVYGMFRRNIPTEVMLCVREVKFRLLFLSFLAHYDAEYEVIINRLCNDRLYLTVTFPFSLFDMITSKSFV